MKRPAKSVIGLIILLATIVFFVYYFASHASVREQLHRVPMPVIGLLLLLYLGTVLALGFINMATLKLCNIRIDTTESLLVTAYSSIVNFFGPLQSGPAFRAVYLKRKYNLNLKTYGLATLVYYFFFALFSGLLLLSPILKGWLLLLVGIIILVAFVGRGHAPILSRLQSLRLGNWYYLALATLLQVSLVAAIYYTELRTIAPGTHFWQAMAYTGAANLALFVSLTPGAIGFREAFLVFSRQLHHISNSTIVAASIVDRAMYIALLLIMAFFIFSTHAQRQLTSQS